MDFATLQCTVPSLTYRPVKREPVLVLSEYPNSPSPGWHNQKISFTLPTSCGTGYIAREPRMVAMVESAGARTI